MPLTLKRIVPENDYDVFDKGGIVGRIYRIHNSELRRWMVRLANLEEAKAALRAAWERADRTSR